MYLTGDVSSFSSRLHQLPQTNADLDSFVIEGRVYMANGLITPQHSGQLELEARRHRREINMDPLRMLEQQF